MLGICVKPCATSSHYFTTYFHKESIAMKRFTMVNTSLCLNESNSLNCHRPRPHVGAPRMPAPTTTLQPDGAVRVGGGNHGGRQHHGCQRRPAMMTNGAMDVPSSSPPCLPPPAVARVPRGCDIFKPGEWVPDDDTLLHQPHLPAHPGAPEMYEVRPPRPWLPVVAAR